MILNPELHQGPPKPDGPVFAAASDILNPSTLDSFLRDDPQAFQSGGLAGPAAAALAHDRSDQLSTLAHLARVSLH